MLCRHFMSVIWTAGSGCRSRTELPFWATRPPLFMSSCSRDPVLLAGRADTKPAANPWDSSRGRPAGAHGRACPCPNKVVCSPPLGTWPFFWGCCWPYGTEVGPTGLLDGSTTAGSTIGDSTRVAQRSTGTAGGGREGRCRQPQEGAGHCKRGFIVLIAETRRVWVRRGLEAAL